MTARRWVRRNEDKPHRCPECHAIATWEHHKYGPRTRLVCPWDCAVQWRVGRRRKRWNRASLARLALAFRRTL